MKHASKRRIKGEARTKQGTARNTPANNTLARAPTGCAERTTTNTRSTHYATIPTGSVTFPGSMAASIPRTIAINGQTSWLRLGNFKLAFTINIVRHLTQLSNPVKGRVDGNGAASATDFGAAHGGEGRIG